MSLLMSTSVVNVKVDVNVNVNVKVIVIDEKVSSNPEKIRIFFFISINLTLLPNLIFLSILRYIYHSHHHHLDWANSSTQHQGHDGSVSGGRLKVDNEAALANQVMPSEYIADIDCGLVRI